jgi:hypothetical protein
MRSRAWPESQRIASIGTADIELAQRPRHQARAVGACPARGSRTKIFGCLLQRKYRRAHRVQNKRDQGITPQGAIRC